MFFAVVIDLDPGGFDHIIQPGVSPLRQPWLLENDLQVVAKGSRPRPHPMIVQMGLNFLKDAGLHGNLSWHLARAAWRAADALVYGI